MSKVEDMRIELLQKMIGIKDNRSALHPANWDMQLRNNLVAGECFLFYINEDKEILSLYVKLSGCDWIVGDDDEAEAFRERLKNSAQKELLDERYTGKRYTKEENEIAMKELKKRLKPNGQLGID